MSNLTKEKIEAIARSHQRQMGSVRPGDIEETIESAIKEALSSIENYNLLEELMDIYLINVDDNGYPKASMVEILDLWGRVKKVLNPKT